MTVRNYKAANPRKRAERRAPALREQERHAELELCAPLAEWVIRKSDREHPADAVLRLELKAQRTLSPGQAADISHLVFSYYRWRGWLDSQEPIRSQLAQAQ